MTSTTPKTPKGSDRAASWSAAIRERGHRAWSWVRRHPFLTIFALPALCLAYALALYPFTPSIGDIKKAKLERPTVVLTADGKELAVFKRANRDWVKLEKISPNVVNALLATEDHRFYDHHGFDFQRTASALVATAGGDRQGGSTITQQLARNLYPDDVGRAPTITRKVKELITALKIEAVYSKKEILETYLNTVPFLYNAYGIDAAARTYFDKTADKLDVVESATLVGMLKGTSYYNPVLNPERAIQRRNTVLAQMVKYDKLPQGQFESLAKKPLKLDFERQPEFAGIAPHLAQNIRRWLIDWADRNDYDIYADGLVVRTTIDSRMQKIANDSVARRTQEIQGHVPARITDGLLKTFLRESSQYKAEREAGASDADALKKLAADEDFVSQLKRDKSRLEGGFLALDPTNGYVKAWVGSRDYDTDKFDHVAQARRQPGSTFKPFVYAAAFESGAKPTDTFVDEPTTIQVDKNQFWTPGDVHESTHMPMTLREGLVKSKNTITVQVMQQVGASRVAQLARAMGVRESPLQAIPSLALGTSPVTLREMVSSYATIANNGGYIEPIVVLSVEDREHHVLEQFHPKLPEQSLESGVSQMLLDVMRGVIDEGTAAGMRPRFGIGNDVDLAGKTGTTQNYTDGWFIAMHPQIVAGAWMGYNDARLTMASDYWGQGAHNALFVVGDFLQSSLKNRTIDAKAQFAVPEGMSKGAPTNGGSVWDPLVGKVNDWWNSMFPSPSGDNEAAVAQSTPVPAVPAPPPMPQVQPLPEPPVVAEPLKLPDSGAMPPSSTAPGRLPDTVLGAPPARAPDATIPAPSVSPMASAMPSTSARTRSSSTPPPAMSSQPSTIDIAPSSSSVTSSTTGSGRPTGSGVSTWSSVGPGGSPGSGSSGSSSSSNSSSSSSSSTAGGGWKGTHEPASTSSETNSSNSASVVERSPSTPRESRESITTSPSQDTSSSSSPSGAPVSQATGSAFSPATSE